MNPIRFELFAALILGIFACGCDSGKDETSTVAQTDTVPDAATMVTENEIQSVLASLSPEDRELAVAQRFCAINVYRRLGSMGTPVKIETSGKPFFVCCEDFVEAAKNGGAKIKRTASGLRKSTARLAKLSPAERAIAESQKYCPVMSSRLLGTMGDPIKLELEGKPVYICCPDCVAEAEASPGEILARVEALKRQQSGMKDMHDDDHKHHHDEHGDHEHHNDKHDDHAHESTGT